MAKQRRGWGGVALQRCGSAGPRLPRMTTPVRIVGAV